jgi:hypothetical protein
MARRAWINQPSTAQDAHALHGTRVLAEPYTVEGYSIVYFLSGPIVSQILHSNRLSEGWPDHLN